MSSMRFELAYLFRFAPWDCWRGKPMQGLLAFFEGPHALRPGRALDIGCGMGRGAIYLAQLGWDVTGLDAVGRALRVARRRAAAAGVKVEFVHGEIEHLERTGITGGFSLFLDIGCFHNLFEKDRYLYSDAICRVATPDAHLIMFALSPNKHLLAPRGVERNSLEKCFSPAWRIVSSAVESEVPYRVPGEAKGTWYCLQRIPQSV
jgi:SAM-dependent methyltransferase